MKCAEMTIARFLEALASPDPTPGGGTAAAMAGAMGTGLLVMVTGLAKSNTNSDAEKAALAAARQALQPLIPTLTELADADAAAFDQVMNAYRLPK
ncbi:MAG: cyclodeaminase/cyclohydrolase family protein, partial [Acidobacteriota bacterium]|nr:cyclodeaminase/cyclohydrolase family protein [Acidobacteriota bacterium]